MRSFFGAAARLAPRSIRSYSAITCAPKSSRVAASSRLRSTAIAVLLSLEFAATLLLFGAQVIAEYERMERGAPIASTQEKLRTG